LREAYDIYEPSCRIMGDNLGGGKQVNHRLAYGDTEKSKAINGVTKPIHEQLPPLPSGANIAKIKSGTGNTHAYTSRTVGAPRPRTAQLRRSVAHTCGCYVLINIYSNTHRARHGGRRTTARHGGQADTYATVYYGMQREPTFSKRVPTSGLD
jgi:hypothetical protein